MLCQEVPDALSAPLTGSPAVATVTWVILPRAAVTVTPRPGLAFLVPFAGVMVSCAPAADVLAAGAPGPPVLAAAAASLAGVVAGSCSRIRWRRGCRAALWLR